MAVPPDAAPAPALLLPELTRPKRRIGGRLFDFSRQVAVMAIVNRTPDSFYDRGATDSLHAAVAAARKAIADGADWVDIGGVKFAPGFAVPIAEEIDRVVPVVEALRGSGAVLSIDTFHPEVALAAISAGAHVINDTTGLHDPAMAEVVADSDATLVITHSLAEPRMPYPAPQYDDVVAEVAGFLLHRVDRALSYGVPLERIVIDPGHDLNKNTLHSLELTRRLGEITTLGLPTLVAVSNKDFVGETLDRARGERVNGSLAAAVFCIMQGARIVRMHNVAAAVEAVRMTEAILGFRDPAYLRHNLE
ncbi:dihydropteroate synthase [Cryobacterium tepidiphilum]|uniref:Dihydropteroate synthase n=1 Tax=Cryobacterium tepidiphilum TaxID=2486026 RepID=A0A3M8KWE7_9MICO|nr:dihydropteroate synthase [Cryobacterium tepidiphilum]RNE56979.1 dihydropteroate synthase [Cryobacterium tepidiphilum]